MDLNRCPVKECRANFDSWKNCLGHDDDKERQIEEIIEILDNTDHFHYMTETPDGYGCPTCIYG